MEFHPNQLVIGLMFSHVAESSWIGIWAYVHESVSTVELRAKRSGPWRLLLLDVRPATQFEAVRAIPFSTNPTAATVPGKAERLPAAVHLDVASLLPQAWVLDASWEFQGRSGRHPGLLVGLVAVVAFAHLAT